MPFLPQVLICCIALKIEHLCVVMREDPKVVYLNECSELCSEQRTRMDEE